MQAVDVRIQGRGAVAMCLALALGQQGLRVALSAPAAAGTADLRAYAINAASRRLLQRLKAWEALPPDAVTPVHDMQVRGDAPGAAIEFSAWAQRAEALSWIVDAAELDAALNRALQFAAHVQRAAALPDAALTVIAEGKDSAAREALGARHERHGYGQTAVAARLVAAVPHEGIAHQWFRSPDVLALLPFDRPAAGRSFALVWSLPDARAGELMALDTAAFERELNDACNGGPAGLRLAGERATWPLAIATASPLCGPGWVLVGDAAHVVHPLAGQGLNLGLGDVQVLAETLAAREPWRALGDERLLQRHVRARAWPTWAMARMTDGLLHGFASQRPWVRELRNRGVGLVDRAAPLKRWLAAQALDG